MQITLSPSRGLPGQPETVLSVAGDGLTVDGTVYDLSAVPEGGLAIPEGTHPFIGPITREGGEIRCTLRVVLGDDAAPDQPQDPACWTLRVAAGPVAIPTSRIPSEADA